MKNKVDKTSVNLLTIGTVAIVLHNLCVLFLHFAH
jgi:hypothetical protein